MMYDLLNGSERMTAWTAAVVRGSLKVGKKTGRIAPGINPFKQEILSKTPT